ncbi:MAG: succinate dehydrogenase cytochrome b subunit [Bernardetiaceae bacterium]|jgi:succinate dehydrogenase / fumarate reductase cytochrome b subunit|nr:succinate dehydrogenase cytochrome b subunit [Bernardetiaceae bacterium]
MNWALETFTSTLGRKVVMALTGLFLSLFLVVHLIGNLQLLRPTGDAFNVYAQFMGHNPVIQTVSIGNFFFILLHVVQSILLTRQNQAARPVQYAYANTSSTWASRNMGLLGTIILLFIIVHLKQFWFEMKFGFVPTVVVEGETVKDLYTIVNQAFHEWWYVAFYVVCQLFLAFHLSHGFESAFQTLGINHPKYTPIIKNVGKAFCVLVPLAYSAIPLVMFFTKPV